MWQALLPGLIATIGGGLAQRAFSQGDIARQNAYNHPINQVRRIREAGLPMSALTGGQSGAQSALPQSDIGAIQAGGKIADYISTRIQQKQLEMLDAQIGATKAQEAKTIQEGQEVMNRNQTYQLDPTQGEPISYGARMAKLEYQIKQTQKDMQENQYEIQKIDYSVKKDLNDTGHLTQETRNRILIQAEQIKQLQQLFSTREGADKAMKVLETSLEKDGMSVGEAFIHLLMRGQLSNFTPLQYHEDK